MTVQEMHISFEQKAGSLGGASLFAYMPDAFDFALTTAQDKLIREQIRPKPLWKVGIEGIQEKYDATKNIVKHATVPFIEFGERHGFNYGLGILPDDYFMLLQDSSTLTCSTIAPTDKTYWVSTVPFMKDVRVTPNKYKDLNIEILWSNATETVYFNLADFPHINTQGFNDADESYFVINVMRKFAPKKVFTVAGGEITIEMYWEKWHNVYKPDNFIFVAYTSNGVPTVSPLNVLFNYANVQVLSTSFGEEEKSQIVLGNATVQNPQNRLVQHEDIGFLLRNSLFTTHIESPVSELVGNALIVYFPRRTSVNGVSITYICKPMAISLKYGLNCEIDELLHDRLVDIAVQNYLGSIPSQKMEALKRENMLIE